MKDPIEPPKTENNPRDGLNPSPTKPTFKPELRPGDIEIIVEAPKEPNTAIEEIVDNKTIRVDRVGEPPGPPNDHKVCCGCAAIGHVLESCPEDHGLKLTDCQMHFMGQTNASVNKMKPAGKGIDQLSDCFQNLTPKSPPASPTKLVTLPIPQGLPADDADPNNIANTRESPPRPTTAIQPEECDEKMTELTREEPHPSTQHQAPNQTTRMDDKTGSRKTKPFKKKPEKVTHELIRTSKPVANVTGKAKATKNVTGKAKATETYNNDAPKGTVKPTPILINPKATTEKSLRDGIGEFD